jgi:lipopolysaccharide export system protein LptA
MNPNGTLLRAGLLIFVATALNAPAMAERADRDMPVNLEADRITVDEAKKIQIFEGNVHLVQGSLVIRTAKLVVTQDADGFQKGIAYGGAGGLARFRQKREAKDEYVDGEADRIEYDGRAEKAEFFNRAHVTSGLDEVRGPYISYDAKTENYIVTGTPGAPASQRERVRAVIQPKAKDGAKPVQPTPARGDAPLNPAADIAEPRQGK